MPAGGFTSPAILALSTWDAPERSFCKQLYGRLREHGYTRYVEPFACAFAMPTVAVAAGWRPEQMECSDVSLFASVVGTMLGSGDFAALDVRLDGHPVDLPDADPPVVAAYLLWLQLLARMQAKPDVPYWRVMVTDLTEHADRHRRAIEEKLRVMAGRLGGLSYRPADVWAHLEAVADDPNALISTNPPTYKAGYERFFDTGGRLTWSQPEYDVFDPAVGIPRICELMEGRKALLVCQQQQVPGHAATDRPIFARHLALGQNVYLNSNRPDEVFKLTGGPKVAPRKPTDLNPLDLPVLPYDAEVTANSRIDLIPVRSAVADYYRGLWMHRLAATPGSGNVLVALDGKAAGILGLSHEAMSHPYPGATKWMDHLIMRFAFAAPHQSLRLTRLATMIALTRSTADLIQTPANSLYLAASQGLLTIEYTRHPEAKGLRGLMKLVHREDHADGHRLVYAAPWRHATPQQTLAEFLDKEAKWQASRKA